MQRRICLLGWFSALAVAGCLQIAAAAPSTPVNLWYSLYFQSTHSGYTHIETSSDTWQGRPATRDDSKTVTKLTIFGTEVEQDISSSSWSDPKTGEPYYQTFSIESGGSVTQVAATFTPSAVTATLKSGAETTTKTIAIAPGQKIIVDDAEGMSSDTPLKVGETESDLEFDPISLSLDKQVSRVLALNVPVKEASDGMVHTADEILVTDPEGSATAFQDRNATPVLVLMPAGLIMLYTDQASALAPDSSQAEYAVDPTVSLPLESASPTYNPSPDLAITTSVSPTGSTLADERTLVQLTAKLTVKGRKTRTVTETAVPVPPDKSDPIDTLRTPATAPFLGSAPYLSVDDPSIVTVELQVIGSETNSYAAVKLLHDWVYAHMTPQGSLGLPRSASDIIANRAGVCRDYAILYATLARAAGIPTKIDAGLVGFHGRFFYHAWASSYIGGTVGWLPVDATMPTMFVDASHIALGSGDATVMFTLSDVIGNMKVETVSTRNSL